MNAVSSLLTLSLAAALGAQSPLTTVNALQGFIWPGVATPNLFFNLTVATTVTIQGFDVNLDLNGSPAGAEGTIEVYTTPNTYVGKEQLAGQWTLAASGPVVSAAAQPSHVCVTPGIVLAPGTYGIALKHVNVRPLFVQGTSTSVPGGTGPGTNQYYQNTELTLLAGSTQPQAFASVPFAPYVWNGNIHYLVGNQPHTCATSVPYGAGCNVVNGSFHQRFASSAAAATALNGRKLSLQISANGYTVAPSPIGVAYVPPSGAAQTLAVGDDGEVQVTLSSPFPYPTGATPLLFVSANGIVSVATNAPTPNSWTPNPEYFFNAQATAWYSWHDFNPAEPNSGQVKFEEVGTLAIVTWDDVESYPGVTTTGQIVNRSTMQMQFDLASGQVNYIWQSITAVGGSIGSDEHIVGFSPAGASPITPSVNLVTLTSLNLTLPEVLPLKLEASPLPVPGNTVNFTTSQESVPSVGINFLCTTGLAAPGVSLAPLGMPGCAALVDINTGTGNVISNLGIPGTSMTISLPIPTGQPQLLGLPISSQSVWLDPAANAFGALTSNAVRVTIGDF